MRIQIRKAALLLLLIFSIEHRLLAQSKQPEHVQVDSLNEVFKELQHIDLDKAEQLQNEALKISIASKYSLGEANTRSNLSVVHYRKGNYAKAIEQCFAAIKIYDQNENFKNSYNYGLALIRLSSALHSENDYKRGTSYLHGAISVAKTIKDNKLLALAYEELGNNYTSLKQFDSAFHYYSTAKKTYLEIGSYKNIVTIESNTGVIYFFKGDYTKAIAHYSEALSINKEHGKDFFYSDINGHYNIGEAYFMLKSYDKALRHLDSAQILAQNFKILGNLLDIYLLKAKTFQAKGNLDSCTTYYEKTIALKDSTYNDTYKKELATLQTQSDVYKKEAENKLLTKDKRIAELYRNLAIAGIVGLAILLAFLLLNQRLRIQRRVKDKLEEEVALRTKEIFRQKETIFQTNLRLKLALNRAKSNSQLAVNLLNTLQQVILRKKAQETQDDLTKLSAQIQYILEKSPFEKVFLHEELQMLEHYIQLQQVQLNHSFRYSIEDKTANSIKIPTLVLQPFIEDAILQLSSTATNDQLYLKLHAEAIDHVLYFTISYNGIDFGKGKMSRLTSLNNKSGQEHLDLLTHLTHKNHLAIFEEVAPANGSNAENKILIQIPIETKPIDFEQESENEHYS